MKRQYGPGRYKECKEDEEGNRLIFTVVTADTEED